MSALRLLQARAAETPGLLDAAAFSAHAFASEHAESLRGVSRWAVTGAGASEGVARAAVDWLAASGRCASFVPLSRWAVDCRIDADGVLLFSQALSPTSRLTLKHAPERALRVLVTATPDAPAAAEAASRGWLRCVHGPAVESDLLVRLSGPACALVAAWALSRPALGQVGEQPPAPGPAFARGLELGTQLSQETGTHVLAEVRVLLTAGEDPAASTLLPWTWMEATLNAPIGAWDALSFAHGPFQALYDQRLTFLAFEHDHERDLFDRVASVLVAGRHTLLRVPLGAPTPLTPWLRLGALWGLGLALQRELPRPLDCWPGKGEDGPLYELGR